MLFRSRVRDTKSELIEIKNAGFLLVPLELEASCQSAARFWIGSFGLKHPSTPETSQGLTHTRVVDVRTLLRYIDQGEHITIMIEQPKGLVKQLANVHWELFWGGKLHVFPTPGDCDRLPYDSLGWHLR